MMASAIAADLRRVEAMRVSFGVGCGLGNPRGGWSPVGAGCPVLASRGGGQLGSGQRTVWGKARAQIGRRAGFTRWRARFSPDEGSLETLTAPRGHPFGVAGPRH